MRLFLCFCLINSENSFSQADNKKELRKRLYVIWNLLVEDKVRSEQHEEREFVALAGVTAFRDLVRETPETRTRYQDLNFRRRAEVTNKMDPLERGR